MFSYKIRESYVMFLKTIYKLSIGLHCIMATSLLYIVTKLYVMTFSEFFLYCALWTFCSSSLPVLLPDLIVCNLILTFLLFFLLLPFFPYLNLWFLKLWDFEMMYIKIDKKQQNRDIMIIRYSVYSGDYRGSKGDITNFRNLVKSPVGWITDWPNSLSLNIDDSSSEVAALWWCNKRIKWTGASVCYGIKSFYS